MNTSTFIKRPVLAMVVSLLIVVVGYMSYDKLSVRQYPFLNLSAISVNTTYIGASATDIESFVTTPIESYLAGVSGIDTITSTSLPGSSSIIIQLLLNYDVNTAMADINSQVSAAEPLLPLDAWAPSVSRLDPNTTPIMFLTLTSEQFSPEEVALQFEMMVRPQLRLLQGVSDATNMAQQDFAMRIWLDPYRLAANQITTVDIQNALVSNNTYSPTGSLKSDQQSFQLSLDNDFESSDDFNQLIISNSDQGIIRLQDVGYAELGSRYYDKSVNLGGKKGIVLAITPANNANPINVSRLVNKLIPKINKELPGDIHLDINYDQSIFINKSINEVVHTIFETTAFVIIVMLIFIGSLRIVLIPAITIPLSLIGTLAIMASLNFSVNTFTLLAMVLAIGLVVDDAIVVAENIFRHIEEGKKAMSAALQGASEIQFTIIAMTFTLTAVYAPLGLMDNFQGILFQEFAFTLASAVIVSGIVALTLSPMMCARIFSLKTLQSPGVILVNRYFDYIAQKYHQLLTKVVTSRLMRLTMLALSLGIFIGIAGLASRLALELVPAEDAGAVLTTVQAPANSNIHYLETYTDRLTKLYDTIPEQVGYGVVNGYPSSSQAVSWLIFKPWHERQRSTFEIMDELNTKLQRIPGIEAYTSNPFGTPGVGGQMPINLVIKTTGDYDDLYETMQKLLAYAKNNPKLFNLYTDLTFDKSSLVIHIDRDKAGQLNVPVNSIAHVLNAAFGQPLNNRFLIQGRSYYVIPELAEPYKNRVATINQLQVRSRNNELVDLSQLVHIERTSGNTNWNHFQTLRSATLYGTNHSDFPLGDAIEFLKKGANQYMKPNMFIDYAGQTRTLYTMASSTSIYILSIIFIYLVLSAQYESFIDPIIVLGVVPLSLFGALVALNLLQMFSSSGGTINLYTNIGMLTLIGLISKHGIMIVDFGHKQHAEGKNHLEATLNAASLRLRPILITTAAMVLGALPLALSHDVGSNCRTQLGWVIIGGMTFGTLMTLFVVPTFYYWLGKGSDHPHLRRSMNALRNLFEPKRSTP